MTGSSVFSCQLGQVAPELVEDERARRGLAAASTLRLLGARVTGQELDDLLTDATEVGAQLHEDLGGDAFALADQPEQDVLGPYVVVSELKRLAERQLEHLLSSRCERDVPRWGRLTRTDDLFNLLAHLL